MRSLTHETIATTSLPPKKYCNDERAKLRLFDTQANTLRAQQLYLASKEVYDFIISKLPNNGQKFTLEPSLKADIVVMLQSVASRLSEAASWHQRAETLLNQHVKPLAKQLGISLNTATTLSKQACLREDLTDEIVATAANSATFGVYGLYSYMTK